jgi:hypothetical protein
VQDHPAGHGPLVPGPEDSGTGPATPELDEEVYDPGAYTVADVQAYVTEHPDELDAIYAAEQSGKARSTLLDWLAAQGEP